MRRDHFGKLVRGKIQVSGDIGWRFRSIEGHDCAPDMLEGFRQRMPSLSIRLD